jgi:4Fe-4S ferredoxin
VCELWLVPGDLPGDAASVVKPFEGEVIMDTTECKGESCHACMDVCPCNAASLVDGKSAIEEKFCILCGACSNVCHKTVSP